VLQYRHRSSSNSSRQLPERNLKERVEEYGARRKQKNEINRLNYLVALPVDDNQYQLPIVDN
jgi:hypothetical protein